MSKNVRVDCLNVEICKIVQEHLLNNGCSWICGQDKHYRENDARFLFVNSRGCLSKIFHLKDYPGYTLTIEEALNFKYSTEKTATIGQYTVSYIPESNVVSIDSSSYELRHIEKLQTFLDRWHVFTLNVKTTDTVKVKVNCKTVEVSQCVQGVLFKNGYVFQSLYRTPSKGKCLYIHKGIITTSHIDYFNKETKCCPISIEEALQLKYDKSATFEAKIGCATVTYKEGNDYISVDDDDYQLCDIKELCEQLKLWGAL